MANFSQNQVRQFYIATALKTTQLSASDAAGTIRPVLTTSGSEFWFEYVTPNGDNGNTVVRSDIVPVANLKNLSKSTTGKTRKLRKLQVEMTDAPVAGKDYILRYRFYGLSIGGVENQYVKEAGVYRAKTGDTKTIVMTALKNSSDLNFKREANTYVTTTVVGDKLEIEEVLLPWVVGRRQASPLNFTVECVPLSSDSEDVWGTVTDITASNINTVGNGRMVADMEWFYIGERADQYREAGFPNSFVTTYLADPTKSYEFLNIDFFYAGNAEDVQKSPKTLSIATAEATLIDGILAVIQPVEDDGLGG